jgi:short-subunit dehydrogenase
MFQRMSGFRPFSRARRGISLNYLRNETLARPRDVSPGLSRDGAMGAAGVVVITGGSSGIGRCTARLFSRHGWRVGLIARGGAGLEEVLDELMLAGDAAAAAADVADSAAVEAAAARLEYLLGPVDVWINCAGNGVYGRFIDVPAEEFERVTMVTYLGTVNGTRAALRRMAPRNAGTVVNVCSAIAFHGMPLLSSYSGAKHAMRGFDQAVRAELAQDRSRVRLATVYPPAVNTPFFSHAVSHMRLPPRPMRPVYQPQVVADAILFAVTSRRREVRVGGTTVAFNLLTRLAPWLAARAINRLGYAGQMTDCREALRLRGPTLFAPSGLPSGVRGPFDAGARRFSAQMWVARHRLVRAGALLGLLGLAAYLTLH